MALQAFQSNFCGCLIRVKHQSPVNLTHALIKKLLVC